mgnify:CR=1 FL=1
MQEFNLSLPARLEAILYLKGKALSVSELAELAPSRYEMRSLAALSCAAAPANSPASRTPAFSGRCHGWEGGSQQIFRSAISSRCAGGTLLLAARGAQGLHWNFTVWAAPRGAGGSAPVQAQCRRWGSMQVMVRDLAP